MRSEEFTVRYWNFIASNRDFAEIILNNSYVERALGIITDKNILVNLATRRASELSRGSKPLVDVPANTTSLDTALLEIAEGKVRYELPDQ